MKADIYASNYQRLVSLGMIDQDGQVRDRGRSQADGYMDLVVERLEYMEDILGADVQALSMAHYFKQNGDLCQDPEMVVLVRANQGTAEAWSFQQAIPPVYREVYPEPGKVTPQAKKELNGFLAQWLENLKNQGHGTQWVQ